MVHNTILFQLYGVIIWTFWGPKERTCERVTAHHTNLPTRVFYEAVKSNLGHSGHPRCSSDCVRDHLKFQKYHQLTSRERVVVLLVLVLTFVESCQVLEWGPVTAPVTCICGVSVSVYCQCCGVEVMQRRRDSVSGLICYLSLLHPVLSLSILMSLCKHVYPSLTQL